MKFPILTYLGLIQKHYKLFVQQKQFSPNLTKSKNPKLFHRQLLLYANKKSQKLYSDLCKSRISERNAVKCLDLTIVEYKVVLNPSIFCPIMLIISFEPFYDFEFLKLYQFNLNNLGNLNNGKLKFKAYFTNFLWNFYQFPHEPDFNFPLLFIISSPISTNF